MLDSEKLADAIARSGLTIVALSSKCGMARETFYTRMSGKSEFKASEIVILTDVLRLSTEERDAIFFAA